MKTLLLHFATAGLLATLAVPAQAVTLEATLTDFDARAATVTKTGFFGAGGGIGTFTITNAPSATGDPLLDSLFASGNQFLAFCLEPDETIGYRSYEFEIVDLASAPTSPSSGPMGVGGQAWIESILAATPYHTIDELAMGATLSQEFAFQAALYEAGYESPATALFDFSGGTAQVTSTGASLGDMTGNAVSANALLAPGALDALNSYALLNMGPPATGGQTQSLYQGQDFMVFTRTVVPEPGVPALLGLGMLGMVGAQRSFDRKLKLTA